MPGYSPVCDNCFKCMTCRGNGYVDETRMSKGKALHRARHVQDVQRRRRQARGWRPRPPLTVSLPGCPAP